MAPLSLTKIFAAIVGIIALFHLGRILNVIKSLYMWLCESFEGMNDFSEGARAAIAMSLVLLGVVTTLRILEK